MTWARLWFALTALCAAAGVALSVRSAALSHGPFHSAVERGFNELTLFTIESNLIAGVVAVLLAVRPDRYSAAFRTLRLTGLVAIIVTGIIYHLVLAPVLDFGSVHHPGNLLVHTVVPLMAVAGWLVFGPRGRESWRVAWLSVLFPCCWLVFTLLRGAVIGWYPYLFIDVTRLGYARVALHCCWIALLIGGLTAAAMLLDARLPRLPRRDDAPTAAITR